ncbi:hypothetical protein CIPAW_02G000600 [Carya illinoinensis]|uniref:Uncharacterized protein n=1 Tax=Carya illinoinensis TaxID=32201 RepID=A0A8T1R6R1_CARIL|nr:hypothetical protein CIPAW_02G000600 [Carya illinoinensis]KAG6724821.1 hypothetical protein I3842_02G000700 [Carya illinoinensis]
MGFEDFVGGRLRCYKKLTNYAEVKGAVARPRRRWVQKMNGGLKGFRVSRPRKLTLKGFSMMLLPAGFAKIYAHIANRMNIDGVCPAIIFPTQWGFPILSHPSVRRKSVISLNRNLTYTP